MKKFTKQFLSLIILSLLVLPETGKAQMSFTMSPSSNCINNSVNTFPASLTNTIAGSFSYSWSVLPANCGSVSSTGGFSTNVSVACAGLYSVICSAYSISNVLLGTVVNTISMSNSPTVTAVASSSVMCVGQTVTLSASGANIFTWNNNTSGGSIVVSPSISTLYSVVGTIGSGCTGTTALVVIVNSQPTINVSSSVNLVCLGNPVTLNAIGGVTYTWSTGQNTQSIVTTPLSNTCFTVMASNNNGCVSMAVHCVTVLTGPAITINTNFTVCAGSSMTLGASGALTYTWQPGASNSNTLSILPTANTVYTISGHGANGCVSTVTTPVQINTGCSDVWPGDANSDGTVDNTDVFEIGLAFNSTGTPRSPGGNTYISQYAANWTGTVSSGKNKNHADCNGDATINNGDTLAIFNNFGLNHSFRPSGEAANPEITITQAQNVAEVGRWNVANVVLGDAASPISQLYGIAFDIGFNPALIETDSIYMTYNSSFLNASNQNVQFRKTKSAHARVYAASVRTDGSNINGHGKIAEIHYKVRSTVADNTPVNFSVGNAKRINNAGSVTAVSGGSLALAATTDLTGLINQSLSLITDIFPNPASNEITIVATSGTNGVYSISDLTGRILIQGEIHNTVKVNVSALPAGIYIVDLDGKMQEKIIIAGR